MKYNKPPLTIEQQVDHLAARGLAIPDKARAAHYLAHLNYYRLRAYWPPLERDPRQHIFKDGANFEHVLDLYVFDSPGNVFSSSIPRPVTMDNQKSRQYHAQSGTDYQRGVLRF